jgi:hypothetical protein
MSAELVAHTAAPPPLFRQNVAPAQTCSLASPDWAPTQRSGGLPRKPSVHRSAQAPSARGFGPCRLSSICGGAAVSSRTAGLN